MAAAPAAQGNLPDLVDIFEIILEFVHNFPLVKDMRKKTDLKAITVEDLDLSKLCIHHAPAKHSNGIPGGIPIANGSAKEELETDENVSDVGASASMPKTHILFSSVFGNNTGETQTYSLRTERRTKNSSRITMTRALTQGSNFSLTLTPPGSLLSGTAGFKSDLTLTSASESNFEEELVWSLDSQVSVRPRCRTRANLVIEENDYEGQFSVETRLQGRISVLLRNSKDGSVLAPIKINDIRTVFTKDKGFRGAGASAVTFLSMGHIRSRYGITQRVDLDEQPI